MPWSKRSSRQEAQGERLPLVVLRHRQPDVTDDVPARSPTSSSACGPTSDSAEPKLAARLVSRPPVHVAAVTPLDLLVGRADQGSVLGNRRRGASLASIAGTVAERTNAPALKAGGPQGPGVRIPPVPLSGLCDSRLFADVRKGPASGPDRSRRSSAFLERYCARYCATVPVAVPHSGPGGGDAAQTNGQTGAARRRHLRRRQQGRQPGGHCLPCPRAAQHPAGRACPRQTSALAGDLSRSRVRAATDGLCADSGRSHSPPGSSDRRRREPAPRSTRVGGNTTAAFADWWMAPTPLASAAARSTSTASVSTDSARSPMFRSGCEPSAGRRLADLAVDHATIERPSPRPHDGGRHPLHDPSDVLLGSRPRGDSHQPRRPREAAASRRRRDGCSPRTKWSA